MDNRCVNCQLPVEQVEGKRAKLYCNPKCKAAYFFKQKLIANSSEMISITKVEYDRLLAAASSWNDRMNATMEAIKNNPPSVITTNEPVLDPIIKKEGKHTGNKVKTKPRNTAAPLIESVGKPVIGDNESKWDFRIRLQEWKDKQ